MKKFRKFSILIAAAILTILTMSVYASQPKVIKMIPENGKQDVDPGLKQIRIEFDQDMDTGGFSICGGGPKFPKTVDKPRWINKRTLVAGVKLEPNHEYEISINSTSYQNCKNTQGEPAIIYPVKFKTAATAEKPATPEKSPSLLLQEALYAEETEGNLDKAIEIYQQVIEQAGQSQRIAAQATYQLGMCHLKKGENEKAAQYFQQVVSNYPTQTVLAEKANQQLQKLKPVTSASIPQVINTNPTAFANDVDPNLDRITVTFNTQMMDQSWSWTGGGDTYPQTTGRPYYDETKTICTLPVKLEPGKAYWVGINSPSHKNFKTPDRTPAKRYVILFATKTADGKPTPIPGDLVAVARKINAAVKSAEAIMTQEMHNTIDANGLIHFKSPNRISNNNSEPITTTGFINSDFVMLTKMYEENGSAIPFETTHEGNIYRYRITFNKPIMPGESMVYYAEGTIRGLIRPVPGSKDVFRYFMVHSPSAGQPVLRIETYLLPEDAVFISTSTPDIQKTEKDGRIELRVEKVVPANGSITTEFQYKLTGAKLASAEPLKLEPGAWDKVGMRMKLTTPVGADIGQMIWRSSIIDINGVSGWRIESFMNVTVANMQQYTVVDALKKTYAPVASQTKNTMMGDFRAQFQTDQVKLTRKADSNEVTKVIRISGPVFDNEQALYVIRKMPLKEGYTGSFNIFPVVSGVVMECKIEVLNGIETIQINSGPIACYKIKLNVLKQGTSVLEHWLWISTDANRYLVKYDSGEAIMEMLQPIVGLNTATLAEVGLQHGRIALPSEWVCLWSPKDGIQESVQIMAPGLPFWAVLVKQPAGTDCNSVNEIAHKDSEKLIGFFKNYTPVAQSWTDLTISKMPATSYYATYDDKGKQMVEYRTYILNKPEVFWFVFRIEKDQFENFKPQFDSVINSFHNSDM